MDCKSKFKSVCKKISCNKLNINHFKKTIAIF